MKTYRHVCLKDWSSRDAGGLTCSIERGKEYLITAPDAEGNVKVFAGYWHDVPVDVFGGESIFARVDDKTLRTAPITREWIAELQRMERYAEVDLMAALHKCQCWACGGKLPSRRRFVRFLDRNYPIKHQPFEKKI